MLKRHPMFPIVHILIIVGIQILNMSELSIEVLKEIVEKLPDDFIVEFKDRNGSTFTVSDDINVKISEKKLVLRTY